MEIAKQFGVEPVLLLAQVVNFLILLFILKRFLYKPILTMLKDRQEKIKQGLLDGQKGEEILAKSQKQEKEMFEKANQETRILIDEAKKRAGKMEEEIMEEANHKAIKVMDQAQGQIEQERKMIEKELEKKMMQAAADMLERVLPKVLTKTDQQRILATSARIMAKDLP